MLYLWFIFFTMVTMNTNPTCTVILINGLGSSGKTSIYTQLQKHFGQQAAFASFDNDVLYPEAQRLAQEEGSLNDATNPEQKEKILFHWRKKMIAESNWLTRFVQPFHKHVGQLISNHKYLFVDTVVGIKDLDFELYEDLQDFLHNIKGCNLIKVLIYCSPLAHVQHIITRQTSQNFKEKRPLNQSLEFHLFYQLTSKEKSIDIITRQEIDQALTSMQNYMHSINMPIKEIRLFIQELDTYYTQLFFQNNNKFAYIQPYLEHDLILNTGKLSTQECCQKILDFIH